MLKVILFLIVVCYVISQVEPNKQKPINQLKAKVRVNKRQIKGLTNSVKSLTEKLTKLEDQDDSIKESFETLKSEFEEEKVRIDTVSKEIADVPDLIENAIDPKIAACEDKIEELQSSTDELYIPKESFETLKAELEEEKVRIDTVSKEIDDVPDLIENAIDPKIDACQKSYKTLKKAVQHERERVTYLIPKVQAVPNLIQTKIDVVQGKIDEVETSLDGEKTKIGTLQQGVANVPNLIEKAISPKVAEFQTSISTLLTADSDIQGKLTKEVASLRSEIATSASSTEELLVLARMFGNVQDVPKITAPSEIGFSENLPGYIIKWFVDPPTTMFNKGSGIFTAERSGVYRVELSFEITDANEGVNFKFQILKSSSGAPEIDLEIKSASYHQSMKDHVERYIILDATWSLTFLLAKSAQIIHWELAIYYVGEKPAQ